MLKHKIFNLFKARQIEGIIFRGVIFFVLSVMKWIDYIQEKDGRFLIGGVLFGIMTLFTLNDYLKYKKENKELN